MSAGGGCMAMSWGMGMAAPIWDSTSVARISSALRMTKVKQEMGAP